MKLLLFLSLFLLLATLGMSGLLKKPSPFDGPGGENRGKSQWPDMLGKRKEVAEAAIKAERPDLTVHTVPEVRIMLKLCEWKLPLYIVLFVLNFLRMRW